MKELTRQIKNKALELGFSKIGIAKAEPLVQEGKNLREWLNKGYHGTMQWMEKKFEKRTDPTVILPGAKSIISVAMNYYAEVQHSQDGSVGKISRYAWGDDYHEIVSGRLNQLLSYIMKIKPGIIGKVYVDTGPMMDKVWAQRAGIGWEGKHTNVITQEYGSWVFLGEIILNLELEYDTPATDHCGSCTLCIEACPTQAITDPYVVDARLCISYLTIEHRGEIAEKLGEKFDRWVYGCDICQDVCPWNEKFSIITPVEEFHPRSYNVAPQLTELTHFTQEEFSSRFKQSPIKRAKLSGLRRNAGINLSVKSH
jgi:epoxyqueuosine reductase